MKDVAFEIVKHRRFPESSKPHKLKVLWWNVGKSHPPYLTGLSQNIQLTDAQWSTRTLKDRCLMICDNPATQNPE